jgi:hypothetical protein
MDKMEKLFQISFRFGQVKNLHGRRCGEDSPAVETGTVLI